MESDDFQHSNMWLLMDATREALTGRLDSPDIIVLVETDGAPWSGSMLKEHDKWGDDVPDVNGVGYYTRGQMDRLPRYR